MIEKDTRTDGYGLDDPIPVGYKGYVNVVKSGPSEIKTIHTTDEDELNSKITECTKNNKPWQKWEKIGWHKVSVDFMGTLHFVQLMGKFTYSHGYEW